MLKKDCENCKFMSFPDDREPCRHCINSATGDYFEPMTNGEKLKTDLEYNGGWDIACTLAKHGFSTEKVELETGDYRRKVIEIHTWLGKEYSGDGDKEC